MAFSFATCGRMSFVQSTRIMPCIGISCGPTAVEAIAVLRGHADSTARDTLYSVLAVTSLNAQTPKKTVFDPSQHADFSSAMKVAVDRAPKFSEDLSTIFFGIREAKRRRPNARWSRELVIQAGAPGMGGTINQPRVNEAQEENPSLILWHGKDPRLQSQQIVQEPRTARSTISPSIVLRRTSSCGFPTTRSAGESFRTITSRMASTPAITISARATTAAVTTTSTGRPQDG